MSARSLIPLLAAVLLLPGLLLAQSRHDTPVPLRGPPFSNPDKLTPMSEEWQAKPVEHADWAKGAVLALSLDQGIYPILLPSVQRFARERNIDIAVQEGTCGTTSGALTNKQSDMGGLCCPPGIEDRLPGLRFHTLGVAPLALFVHGHNPVVGMTLAQARDIYSGKRLNWSDFKDATGGPGPAVPVRAVTRLHCKTRPGHWRLLLDHEDQFGPQLREVSTIDDFLATVGDDPGAMGWEVLWNIEKSGQQPKLRTLRINGFAPSDEAAVARGDYPLYRAYNLTTWQEGANRQLVDELVAYLLQEVEKNGPEFGVVPTSRLRAAGWRFRGDEVIGEPR